MPNYLVRIEMSGETLPVGTLDVFENRGREHYQFQYVDTWIEHPLGFGIDPMLSLMKTIVQDGGAMWIAKFPSQEDDRRVALWEALILKMAGTVGIKIPESKVIFVSERNPVLLVKRFDRMETGKRIHFMSAMTMLGRDEKSAHSGSYVEMAETLITVASNPDEDARQIWKRMVFNVLTGNTDDHLRNHGFFADTNGMGPFSC